MYYYNIHPLITLYYSRFCIEITFFEDDYSFFIEVDITFITWQLMLKAVLNLHAYNPIQS